MGKSLGIVVFFGKNDEGTFNRIGQTQVMPYFNALNVYANTPNPASQLVSGDKEEDVVNEAEEIVKKMRNKDYVEEYIDPYL